MARDDEVETKKPGKMPGFFCLRVNRDAYEIEAVLSSANHRRTLAS